MSPLIQEVFCLHKFYGLVYENNKITVNVGALYRFHKSPTTTVLNKCIGSREVLIV